MMGGSPGQEDRLNRDQKAAVIDEVAAQISESEAVFAVDYRGISVPDAAELRTRLRDADASFRVVKNTLTERAADRAGADGLKALLEGPTAMTFVRGDAAAAAKALSDFRRASGGTLLQFKGGWMNGAALDTEQMEAIARLPTREVLYGRLVGMVASLTVLGLSTLLLSEPSSPFDPVAIITLVCLTVFIGSFAATWGPTIWVMLPEVLPLRIRGTAMGLAIFLHWIANFIVSQTFPPLLASIGPGITFLGYAVIGVLAFVFVSAMVTETKGRSLEQIEADLREKASFSSG
jgi:large subunit ribosomal protein L10